MGLFRPFTNAPVVLAVVVATAPLKSKVHVKPPEDKWNLKPIIWLRSDWIQAKHSVSREWWISFSSCARWWKLSESSNCSAGRLGQDQP